jgi:hypothetical protein
MAHQRHQHLPEVKVILTGHITACCNSNAHWAHHRLLQKYSPGVLSAAPAWYSEHTPCQVSALHSSFLLPTT